MFNGWLQYVVVVRPANQYLLVCSRSYLSYNMLYNGYMLYEDLCNLTLVRLTLTALSCLRLILLYLTLWGVELFNQGVPLMNIVLFCFVFYCTFRTNRAWVWSYQPISSFLLPNHASSLHLLPTWWYGIISPLVLRRWYGYTLLQNIWLCVLQVLLF